jgi:hypothetical protein
MPDTKQHATTPAADPATTKHYEISFVYANGNGEFSTQADLTETERAYLLAALDRHEAQGNICVPLIFESFEIHQDFAEVKNELGDALGDATLGTEAAENATTRHMQRRLAAAVLLLASLRPGQTAFAESAEAAPNAPTRAPAPAFQGNRTPAAFWGLAGAYSAAILADNFTTQAALKRGCREVENPMLYGRQPSVPRFLGVSFGIEAGEVFAARRMVRARSRAWHAIGYALIAGEAAARSSAAAKNERTDCR